MSLHALLGLDSLAEMAPLIFFKCKLMGIGQWKTLGSQFRLLDCVPTIGISISF